MDKWLVIVGFIASVSGAVVTYIIGKRKTSGSVDTSDATTLWQESKAMRKELRDEVIALRAEINDLKKTVAELEQEKALKETKIKRLLAQIKTLEDRIKRLEKTYRKSK